MYEIGGKPTILLLEYKLETGKEGRKEEGHLDVQSKLSSQLARRISK